MAAKPSKLPRWADNPPVAPPTTITEPSEVEKDVGYQPGVPRRTHTNWFFNLVYQWAAFFLQAIFLVGDFLRDLQALPGYGSLPATGAGLTVAAASFSGRGYIGGYGVGPIDAPAFTYTASKDHYWDLDKDGVWHCTVVNNGAGAPAIFANSARFYKVVTNATNRTSVVDFRRTNITCDTNPINFNKRTYFGDDHRADAPSRADVRVRMRGAASPGDYTHLYDFPISEVETDSANVRAHLYLDNGTGELFMIRGALWDGGGNWIVETGATNVERVSLLATNCQPRVLSAAHVGASFADAGWNEALDGTTGGSKSFTSDGGFVAGSGLTGSNYEKSEVPRYHAVGDTGFGARRMIAERWGNHMRGYAAQTDLNAIGGNGGFGGSFVSNAYYKASDAKWYRQSAGRDSYALELAYNGVNIYRRLNTDADGWADAINPTTGWTNLFSFGSSAIVPVALQLLSTLTVTGSVTAATFVPTTGTASPAAANTLYKANIVKAWGFLKTDGAGGFSVNTCFGCTPSFTASNITLTWDTPFTTAAYAVVSSQHTVGHGTLSGPVDAATGNVSVYDVNAPSPVVNLSTTPNHLISFIVMGHQ
jgi:hypothetical protein